MKTKQIIGYLSTKKFWVELIIMTVGINIAGAAVYYFLVPSKLIIGTISGLSIVICNLFPKLSLSVVIMVINALLLIMAYFLIGKEFGIKTVYTAMLLGPMTDFWNWVLPWEKIANNNLVTGSPSVMGDPWLDLCCFVLLLSLSQAVLFKINASTGGLDILAKIVNKYLHFDIGASVSVAGGIICCTAFLINDFRMVVIGLIGTWINGLVVDYFTAGLNTKKRVCIISPEYEYIKNYIVEKLARGVTLYDVTGGYSNEKKVEIEALLTKDEFANLMEHINNEHINAFITAGNVSEVYGLWGDRKRQKRERNKI